MHHQSSVRSRTSRVRPVFWILSPLFVLLMVALGLELQLARTDLELRRRQIESTWINVENDLAQRALLAAELVETVSGLAPPANLAKESRPIKESLKHLSLAGNRADIVEANLRVERAIRQFAIALGTHSGSRKQADMVRVQNELLAIEHRIALDRTAYNEAVQRFNTRLALFPANLAGRVFGIERYRIYVPTDLRDPIRLPVDAAGKPDEATTAQ